MEVFKEGYKPYYATDVKTPLNLNIPLEPQKEYFEFKEIASKKTEFSIWWIKPSRDWKYFAVSQGAHPNPEIKPPKEVGVYLFNEQGKQLWRYPIPVENYDNIDLCWGLDISPDGSHVAVGCFDGNVYLLDQKGNLVKKFNA